MEQYQTERGRREDLEQIETNPYYGFVGGSVMPAMEVATKQGRLYYRTLTSDQSAETGRSQGTAPSRTFLSDSSLTYTASEAIQRFAVERDEVKQMGGIEQADRLGASAAKRTIERHLEQEIAKDVLLNDSATLENIGDNLIPSVEDALHAIHRYPGRKAFVCSATIFNRIMRYTEIENKFDLSSAAVAGQDARDIVGKKPAALRMVLAGLLSVDDVIVGDDDQWFDTNDSMKDRAAVMALPDPETFSQKMDPVFGKQVIYLPDGNQRYYLESFYDDDDKVNNYDCSVWFQNQVFNTGALYLLYGIDSNEATTTTTT